MKLKTTNVNYNINEDNLTTRIVVSLSGTSDDNEIFTSATVTLKEQDVQDKKLDELSRKEISDYAIRKLKDNID